MAGLKSRLEKAEGRRGSNVCLCQRPALIEIIEVSPNESPNAGPCGVCGASLPVSRIEAVRPEGGRL
jgi:hypothetical protein